MKQKRKNFFLLQFIDYKLIKKYTEKKYHFFDKKIWSIKKTIYICTRKTAIQADSEKGRLAQLVQSTCLTSRGSLVRIQYRPRMTKKGLHYM